MSIVELNKYRTTSHTYSRRYVKEIIKSWVAFRGEYYVILFLLLKNRIDKVSQLRHRNETQTPRIVKRVNKIKTRKRFKIPLITHISDNELHISFSCPFPGGRDWSFGSALPWRRYAFFGFSPPVGGARRGRCINFAFPVRSGRRGVWGVD